MKRDKFEKQKNIEDQFELINISYTKLEHKYE
jgi:hypothetical protein